MNLRFPAYETSEDNLTPLPHDLYATRGIEPLLRHLDAYSTFRRLGLPGATTTLRYKMVGSFVSYRGYLELRRPPLRVKISDQV